MIQYWREKDDGWLLVTHQIGEWAPLMLGASEFVEISRQEFFEDLDESHNHLPAGIRPGIAP